MIKRPRRERRRRSGTDPVPRTALQLVGVVQIDEGRISSQELESLYRSFAQLIDAAHQTDPINGPPSAKNKDDLAHITLFNASALFYKLCGWAIDHCTGLVMHELKEMAIKPHLRDHHKWEDLGRVYHAGKDPNLDRTVLISLLLIANFLPNRLAIELRHGLDALEVGEVTPLLTPAPTHARRGKHSLDHLRRRGLYLVHFRKGQGGAKGAIYQQMADAYGVTVSAVLTWEHRLRKASDGHFGQFLAQCRKAGAIIADANKGVPATPRSLIAYALNKELSLEELGRMYRETQRRVQKKSHKSGH